MILRLKIAPFILISPMIQSDGDSDYRSAGVMVWNFLPGFIRLEIVVLTSGRIRLECSKPDDEAGWIGGQSGNFLIPRCIDSMAKRGKCVIQPHFLPGLWQEVSCRFVGYGSIVHKTFRFVTLDAEHFDFRGCPVLFTPLIEMMPIMLVLLMSAAPVALPVMFTLNMVSDANQIPQPTGLPSGMVTTWDLST